MWHFAETNLGYFSREGYAEKDGIPGSPSVHVGRRFVAKVKVDSIEWCEHADAGLLPTPHLGLHHYHNFSSTALTSPAFSNCRSSMWLRCRNVIFSASVHPLQGIHKHEQQYPSVYRTPQAKKTRYHYYPNNRQ